MGVGSWMAFSIGIKPVYPVVIGGDTYAIYIGLIALVLNLIVSLAANGLLKLRKDYAIMDQTNATDYEAKDA